MEQTDKTKLMSMISLVPSHYPWWQTVKATKLLISQI